MLDFLISRRSCLIVRFSSCQKRHAVMRYLYSTFLTLAAVLGGPYWIFKVLRDRKYLVNFRQRLGLSSPPASPPAEALWIHAVSVGEVLAAKPLFVSLKERRTDLPIVVSTVTLTGQALAKKELSQATGVFYFPFDWAFSIRRILRVVRPRAVVLMETELWPNFLRICAEAEIPVFLANGRISDASLRRYRHIRWLSRYMLKRLKLIGAQTHEDKRRFEELGADESRVRVTGNLKFDFRAPNIADTGGFLEEVCTCLGIDRGNRAVVIGSSMKGEEELFLEAFKRVRSEISGVRLILAPRHPERFGEVAELIAGTGISFCRRTQMCSDKPAVKTEILLLDTIGELRAVYSLAAVAVIGGSFMPFGGHNLLEPAALGKAIVFGPEMSNFKEMARLFLREQAARQCSPQELPGALTDLLRNPRACDMLGHRAAATFRRNQGATEATLAFLLPYLN